jgi:hypothetical protein
VRVRPVLSRQAALSGKSAAALLLVMCCAPALASSGIEAKEPAVMASQVASILREIFDEAVPEEQDAEAAPLAVLAAPDLREISRDIDAADLDGVDSDNRKSESDLTRVKTSVSGISEDELSRFRHQMFRTDI